MLSFNLSHFGLLIGGATALGLRLGPAACSGGAFTSDVAIICTNMSGCMAGAATGLGVCIHVVSNLIDSCNFVEMTNALGGAIGKASA